MWPHEAKSPVRNQWSATCCRRPFRLGGEGTKCLFLPDAARERRRAYRKVIGVSNVSPPGKFEDVLYSGLRFVKSIRAVEPTAEHAMFEK